MAEQEKKSRRNQSYEMVEKVIEDRVSHVCKEEVLEIYEDLLKTIWNRIVPTLGRVTVVAIMDRALVLTKEAHSLIGQLHVTNDGISFDKLRQHIEEEEKESLHEALKELIVNFIDILAMLTGDILVKQLVKEIEGSKYLCTRSD